MRKVPKRKPEEDVVGKVKLTDEPRVKARHKHVCLNPYCPLEGEVRLTSQAICPKCGRKRLYAGLDFEIAEDILAPTPEAPKPVQVGCLNNPTFPVFLTDSCHRIAFPLINQQGYIMTCQLLFRVTVEGRSVFTASLMIGEPEGRMSQADNYGCQIRPHLKAWEESQLRENPQLALEGMPEATYLEQVIPLVKDVWGVTPRLGRLPLVVQEAPDGL